ncbi:hypothetical protein [Flavobacterium aquiphilum]|uniref:hypothetical protein n=1 Tax=Flavobacterium aquiphilum TaxID=3003261 RepID=UPI0024815D17|nr:hypothetical protein [Flavobacterium aquiphilum]
MKRKLPQNFVSQKFYSIILLIGLFIVGFNQSIIAQCSIVASPAGNINASTLTCGTSPLSSCNGTLTVGNGSSITNIYMDAALDLTCLGAIQVTVKNKGSFDFSPGNNRLYLAEGSSITFESGSSLIGGSCNASERIYIGTNLLASCNGGSGADTSFSDLLNYGGTGSLASNSPVCVGSQIILTATPPPTSSGTFTYSFSGPGLTATPFSPSPTYSFTATATTTGTYQVKIKNSGITNPMIAEISVVVNSLPATPTISIGGPTTFCAGGSVVLSSSTGTGYFWSPSNETTQSISATTSGSYTVKQVDSNGCQSASSSAVVVTVNPNLPASVSIGASPAGAICSGTSVTFTATSTNGGTNPSYQWKLNGSNVGTNSTTYTNAGLANGDVVSCMLTSNASPCLTGSPATSNFVTMTVNPQPVAPTLNNITLLCNQTTATQIWTAISNISSYRFDVSTDSSFGSYLSGYQNLLVDGAATSLDVSGLDSAITYYVRARSVSSTCGISPNSPVITISLPITKTTDGVTWDNGAPDNKRAVFAGNATITSQVNACSCQINSGVNVVFGVPGGTNANAVLKLENGLNVLGTGTLTFENNASLIQVNDAAVNTGKIIYKRISAPMKNFDYTYWSSPVVGQKLYDLSPNTLWDKYFSYENGSWQVYPYGVGTMDPGKGYIIRVPKPNSIYPNGNDNWTGATYAQPVQFIGVPNNGSITIATQGVGKNNLIGNPYPSGMDADLFITENASLIGGALYFWTHNTAITQSGSFYVYDSNDYASYNLTGGVAATTGGAIPNGKIAAGQSFFVVSNSASNFVFNNSMRNTADVLTSGSNSQFFRMSQTKKMAAIEENRIWLNLANSGGVFKQLLVGYITGATNEIDKLYDAISLDGNSYIDFYSINSGSNLAIQGRTLPFSEADQVPLGYRTTIQGSLTISIGKTDGILADQNVFIEDKVTGAIANLKNGPYTFSTATGVFNNRFILRFIANNTSKIASKIVSDSVDNSVLVFVKDKQIKVNSFDQIIDKVLVYDLKASLLYQKEDINSSEFVISNFASIEQFLIVQVLLKNGKWITKEIVFR